MDVNGVIEFFGGKESFNGVLVKRGHLNVRSTPYVWIHRRRIPDAVLVSLMQENRKFDPADFGWQVKRR